MLLHDDSYLRAIHTLMEEANSARVAVAFWGEGSESAFRNWRGESLRILCNLSMGGSNPSVIPKLQALRGAEVRQVDNLHAKLVMTDHAMVLGSANMSCNGLGLEGGEVAGFRELGLQTTDSILLKQAGEWFDALWCEARPVLQSDLDHASELWAKRRASRPTLAKKRPVSLLELTPEIMKDRAVYFAVFRSGLSAAALRVLEEENAALANQSGSVHAELDLYEGWEESDLPKDPSAIVIPIYWGARGKIRIHPPQRPVPELESSHVEDDEVVRLDFMAYLQSPQTQALPFKFPMKGDMELSESLRRWMQSLQNTVSVEGDVAFCMPVYEFLVWYWNDRSK